MARLRRFLVLLACVLVVAVLAGVSALDPFHLRQARWYTAGFVALALVLLTALFAVVTPRGPLRWFALFVGVAVVIGWTFVVGAASTLVRDNGVVAEADQGGRRLLVLRGSAPDPVYAVVVRAGAGPFEQESLVYQAPAQTPVPTARFADDGAVAVQVGPCAYRSTVEADTLDVEPVHRPLQLGC